MSSRISHVFSVTPIESASYHNIFISIHLNSFLHVLQNNSVDDYIPDIPQELLFLPQYVHSYGIPIP